MTVRMSDAKELVSVNDFETTGLDDRVHEIIDFGMIIVHGPTLEIVKADTFKAKPERIELASPEALRINGYTPEKWKDALTKREAIERYRDFHGDVNDFASWNTWMDRRFLRAFELETGVSLPLDYHTTDNIVFLAKELVRIGRIEAFPKLSLKEAGLRFGIAPEPDVHEAMNGVMNAVLVWRALRNALVA